MPGYIIILYRPVPMLLHARTSESQPASKKTFFWQYRIGDLKIGFDGVPFSVGEKRTLDWQHGNEYYKKQKTSSNCNQLQGTRKMGCNAHIICWQYTMYPDYGKEDI